MTETLGSISRKVLLPSVDTFILVDNHPMGMATALAALVDFAIQTEVKQSGQIAHRVGVFTSEKAESMLDNRCKNGSGDIVSIRRVSGLRLKRRIALDLRVDGCYLFTSKFDLLYGQGAALRVISEQKRVIPSNEHSSQNREKSKRRTRNLGRYSRNKLHRRCTWQLSRNT
jgi:hypothetical protein